MLGGTGGLRASHGSDLDMRIPRAKLPKRALPDSLRRKIKGVSPNDICPAESDDHMYKAGNGVLAAAGSAPDGKFLKRGSGVPMSHRASALAQARGDAAGARATIRRSRLAESSEVCLPLEPGRRESDRERRRGAGQTLGSRSLGVGSSSWKDKQGSSGKLPSIHKGRGGQLAGDKMDKRQPRGGRRAARDFEVDEDDDEEVAALAAAIEFNKRLREKAGTLATAEVAGVKVSAPEFDPVLRGPPHRGGDGSLHQEDRAGVSGAVPAFELADRFAGRQQGMVFKLGRRGLGYYRDEGPFAVKTTKPRRQRRR